MEGERSWTQKPEEVLAKKRWKGAIWAEGRGCSRTLRWESAWSVLGIEGVSGLMHERCGGEESGSEQQLAWFRLLDFTLNVMESLPWQLCFPQVTENVSEPLLKAFPVSGNPLNQERGMTLTPKSPRGQVIHSSYC